jgi:hypothetical protein
VRSDDDRTIRFIRALNHKQTKDCVDCERSFLAALDGSCKTPIAGQVCALTPPCLQRGVLGLRRMCAKVTAQARLPSLFLPSISLPFSRACWRSRFLSLSLPLSLTPSFALLLFRFLRSLSFSLAPLFVDHRPFNLRSAARAADSRPQAPCKGRGRGTFH